MDGSAVESRNRTCPGCGAPTIQLPVFVSRRRHSVTCTNCGARLERVLPGLPYYSLKFGTALVTEITILPLVIFGFMGKWVWIAALLLGLTLVNLGISTFLNARTRVEFADPADARQDKPFRWYPK